MADEPRITLPAGAFASWLAGMQRALRGESASDVPCGSCTACCTASQFVHIGPEEADARRHIPPAVLFPAPGLPDGHLVMGYDEHGCCPMLIDGTCSIYAHRPRACRTYDCRIFPATGLEAAVAGKPEIAAQVARWRFAYPADDDRALRRALRVAVATLAEQAGDAPGAGPSTPDINLTGLAIAAVERCESFLDPPRG